MPRVPFPVKPGLRTVVAMTCAICHEFQPGHQFGRSRRGQSVPYLDRRCRRCRWSRMEANPGR